MTSTLGDYHVIIKPPGSPLRQNLFGTEREAMAWAVLEAKQSRNVYILMFGPTIPTSRSLYWSGDRLVMAEPFQPSTAVSVEGA